MTRSIVASTDLHNSFSGTLMFLLSIHATAFGLLFYNSKTFMKFLRWRWWRWGCRYCSGLFSSKLAWWLLSPIRLFSSGHYLFLAIGDWRSAMVVWCVGPGGGRAEKKRKPFFVGWRWRWRWRSMCWGSSGVFCRWGDSPARV